MSEVQSTSYDELPYGHNAFSYTHPDCLATVATLFGVKPPQVDHCRVLELGCARGTNLIPMAYSLPDSRFVGIDLSRRQIASGQQVAEALRLSNIALKPMNILEIDEGFGQFDYIVCHGVYSWVPAVVQSHILTICARNLAPAGVAYVSYNTYPGWHLRGMVRDMMRFHVRQFSQPRVCVEQARTFLDFMVQSIRDPNGLHGRLLKQEADLLRSETDSYLFHEYLEEVNHPTYFYQFVERAAEHGLQYLGEARPSALASSLQSNAKSMLGHLSTNVTCQEQYLDFLCNRTFRRTLLCHDNIALDRTPSPERLTALQVTGLVKPDSPNPDIHSNAVEQFRTANDVTLSTNRPLVKAALLSLFEVWPRALPFGALWAVVQSRLGQASEQNPEPVERERRLLAEALLKCYISNLVELHIHPFCFVLEISERPVAGPLARLQAANGGRVTNLRHRNVELSEFDCLVLRYLDGSRDRQAVLDVVVDAVTQDFTVVQQTWEPLENIREVRQLVEKSLDPSLRRLADSALLVG